MYEEYVDYIFPADDRSTKNLANLLAMARSWKESGGAVVAAAAPLADATDTKVNGNGDVTAHDTQADANDSDGGDSDVEAGPAAPMP